jgi:hypothetical protein
MVVVHLLAAKIDQRLQLGLDRGISVRRKQDAPACLGEIVGIADA